jgi:ecdysteroid kinase
VAQLIGRDAASRLGLAGHLGRGVQRVATDAVARGARKFPRRVSDLDAATLSRLIGRTVTGVSVIDGDTGTSSRARLALTGEGVPESVFVKAPAATAATRLMGELGRLADTEVRFYQQLAPELADDVPKSYGSAFDPLTGRFVVVLEDLAVDSCEFPDTLNPISADRASQIVELLARVHATFWGRLPEHTGKGPFGWIYSASGDVTTQIVGSMAKLSARRIAERTDIDVGIGSFINDNYRAVAQLVDRGPHTVMHGDAHPGNVYFRNGTAGLLDWQAVRRGNPSRELAYTLITSMTTADRQASERDLLDTYRAALAAAGGPELDRDELWERYRQGAQYPYGATLIVAGMGGMQSDQIALEGLRRSVAAIEDLETVPLLQKELS